VWKVQSSFPAVAPAHISLVELAKKVEEMSGGRLKWEILPAGAIVPAFDILDAVHKGVLDGGYGVSAYWIGKHRATSLFGTSPAFGMDSWDLLSWHYYGGGKELYDELLRKELKMNVVTFHTGPLPSQAFGWFGKAPIRSAAELKSLKYRTVGLAADLFREMGAALTILPIGEVIPAIERGVLEAAEICCPTTDKVLGFPDVLKICMVHSFHQPAEYLELILNKDKWDALPPDLQAIVRNAALAEAADFYMRDLKMNMDDLEEMVTKRGVKVYFTPPEILRAQLEAWDRVLERESKANPFFAKVVESQKAWARRAVPYRLQFSVPRDIAFEYYWKR
jgi:TRAP-type mannitol/chloroaromatic compound transport system substrate-binding protein